jgi:hypothetical protein
MKLSIRMCDTPPIDTAKMLEGREGTGLEHVTCWNIFEIELDKMEYGKLFRMAYRAFTSLTGGSDAVWMALSPKKDAAFVLHMKGERKPLKQNVKDYLSGMTRSKKTPTT